MISQPEKPATAISEPDALRELLQADARGLEPPAHAPSAGRLWWQAQIMRRLAESDEGPVARPSTSWPYLAAVVLFLILANAAVLSLVLNAQGLAMLAYGFVGLLPATVVFTLAIILCRPESR